VWDEEAQAADFLVLRTEASPFTHAMTLIPHDADQTRRELRLFPKLVKAAVLLHQGLDIGDDDPIFPVLDIL
jgi:hypothetical protein